MENTMQNIANFQKARQIQTGQNPDFRRYTPDRLQIAHCSGTVILATHYLKVSHEYTH